MALTFGFYNSLNEDRKYNAIQMSSIFDGIIRDGILMTVGARFAVNATGGLGISVGTGRAWFDHTWTLNDSTMNLTVQSANPLLDRIDALVLEVDRRDAARMNSIRWVYGTPATIAQKPALVKQAYINQYPLAYVSVPRGTTNIQQANITNMIGTADTPFVTAPLEKIDTNALFAQWNSQWAILLNSMENQKTNQQTYWQAQMNVLMAQYNEMLLVVEALESGAWTLINNNFDDWSVRRGCRLDTTFSAGTGPITQTIKIEATGFKLADKITQFNYVGNVLESILETVTFYAYEMPDPPRTVLTTNTTITKLTVFNANGSISEFIGGATTPAMLMDAGMSPLQDAGGSDLKVWG